MKFFFDRCMSITLCRMVAVRSQEQFRVVHHDEDGRFNQSTTDVEWISTLAADAVKPIAISGDTRILKKPDEVAALQASGLMFVCLAPQWAQLSIDDMTWKFFKLWPDIMKSVRAKEPTVFKMCGGSAMKIEEVCKTRDIAK